MMAALLSRVRLKFWENEGLAASSLFLGQAQPLETDVGSTDS